MENIEIQGNIGSLLRFYREERRIFGRCPHCSEPFRLSEVKLSYGKEPPKDLLSRMKSERDRLQAQVEELNSHIEELDSEYEDAMDSLKESHMGAIDALND